MDSNRRKTRYIPSSVQASLLGRAVFHWTFLLSSTLLILVCWQYLIGEPHQTLGSCLGDTWQRFGPCFVVLLMVLPVVVHDTVKFSNRLAGPLLRLGRAMESLANNEPVGPIRFRKGDFCQELAEYFNTALLQFQKNGTSAGADENSASESRLCELSSAADE
jgi:hypothetical protein